MQLQTEQHRCGVLRVDVAIRLRLGQWRGKVAEFGVVERQDHIGLGSFQMKHRDVPPQMVAQIAGAVPVAVQVVDPGYAFGAAALHFQRMRDAVRGPHIGWVVRDGGAAGGLGFGVETAFLAREAAAGKQRAVVRQFRTPGWPHCTDRWERAVRAAKPEIGEVRQAERECVARMRREDLLPYRAGVIRFAIDPRGQRGDVRLFALRRGTGAVPRSLQRCRRKGNLCLLVGQHRQIALETMRQRDMRIPRQQRRQALPGIRAIADVARDRVIKCAGCRGGVGAQRQSV
jgi:hypothetical protein